MQNAYTAMERCRWPVLIGVDGGCIGAGVDMITACDIAYCTKKSFFSIKEVDIGMTADLGTFQRMPIITANWHLMKEYALTGEKISPDDALRMGIVSRVFEDDAELKSSIWLTRTPLQSCRSHCDQVANCYRRYQAYHQQT